MSLITIFSAKTTTGTSSKDFSGSLFNKPYRTFQASGQTTSGSGAATIVVQVSNDNTNWITLNTISLTLGTTTVTGGFASTDNWRYVRGNVTAISGTGASISLVGWA